MMFAWLAILGVVLFLVWKTWVFVNRGRTPLERSLAMRGAAIFWFLGFLFLVGIVLIPMPFKLLFVIPAFLVGGTVAKVFRDARNRLAEERTGRVDIEKMKRVN